MIIVINMVGRLFLRRNQGHMAPNYICNEGTMTSSWHKHFYFLLFLLFSSSLFAQPSVDAGKTLFRNVCAQCHAKDMKTKATGPALGGLQERWADYPREDLYAWVRNSANMINVVKHPRAVELWDEWKPAVMQSFTLTDEEIESLFLYVDDQLIPKETGTPGAPVTSADNSGQYNWLYWILFLILGALALILMRIIGSLDKMVATKDGEVYEEKPFLKRVFTKRVVSFLIFGLIVIAGYNTVTNAINFGRQQGYAPEQPIKFSHETHAGVNKIECQYCHDGARRSKHSVIPAANTCMNCHSAIQIGSEYGTAELTKIYASIGYDPNSGQYIDNYTSLDESEIKAIYTKWITDTYLDEAGLEDLDKKGSRIVEAQWTGIKESLTNEQKKQIPGPIEWTRVHNLPDHVYFSHEQHVTVGQVECQSCHGKVEAMETMVQDAPLSMGWCINCHRQTEVKFEGNEYYASYEAYHAQLATGEKEKITVEDIGGLECQKCHY